VGNILQEIEELRDQLGKIGIEKGFHDPEVIKMSRTLDKEINEYFWIRRNELCSKIAG